MRRERYPQLAARKKLLPHVFRRLSPFRPAIPGAHGFRARKHSSNQTLHQGESTSVIVL
jgi:hypothetical protein